MVRRCRRLLLEISPHRVRHAKEHRRHEPHHVRHHEPRPVPEQRPAVAGRPVQQRDERQGALTSARVARSAALPLAALFRSVRIASAMACMLVGMSADCVRTRTNASTRPVRASLGEVVGFSTPMEADCRTVRQSCELLSCFGDESDLLTGSGWDRRRCGGDRRRVVQALRPPRARAQPRVRPRSRSGSRTAPPSAPCRRGCPHPRRSRGWSSSSPPGPSGCPAARDLPR